MGSWSSNYVAKASEKRQEWISWLTERIMNGMDTSIYFAPYSESEDRQHLVAHVIWDNVQGYEFGFWYLGNLFVCQDIFSPKENWASMIENVIAKLDELAIIAKFMWGNKDKYIRSEEPEFIDTNELENLKETHYESLGDLLKEKLDANEVQKS